MKTNCSKDLLLSNRMAQGIVDSFVEMQQARTTIFSASALPAPAAPDSNACAPQHGKIGGYVSFGKGLLTLLFEQKSRHFAPLYLVLLLVPT